MLTGIRTLVLLLLIGTLAACQSNPVSKLYDGPERPVTELVAVQIPETLEILSINGQSPAGIGNRLFSVDRTIHLAPGRYEIIAFYKDILTPPGASIHVVLRSEPVIFDVEGGAGSAFYLEYEIPENYEAAQKLSKNFSGWSRSRDTSERAETRPSGVARPSLLSSFSGGSTAAAPTDTVNSGTTKSVAPAPANVPVSAPPIDAQQDDSYLDMLKAYWSQASQEERRAFLRWVAE